MTKQIPEGFLGSADAILICAHVLDPVLWDAVEDREARIWNRLLTSADAWKQLDQLLKSEAENKGSPEAFDRKESFLKALNQIRKWLCEGTVSAFAAPASWYLGSDIFDLYELPCIKKDAWIDDAFANRALFSGVFLNTTDETHAGDFLLLMYEEHFNLSLDLLQRHAGYFDDNPSPAASYDPKPEAAEGPRKRKGGRRSTHDPLVVRQIVFDLMDDHGDFMPDDPVWNGLVRLEQAVRTKLASTLAESSLRAAVTPHYQDWKAGKAGNDQ